MSQEMGGEQSGPLNDFINVDSRNNSSQNGELSCFALVDHATESVTSTRACWQAGVKREAL
jgi:hypothetical protein